MKVLIQIMVGNARSDTVRSIIVRRATQTALLYNGIKTPHLSAICQKVLNCALFDESPITRKAISWYHNSKSDSS